MTEAEWLACNDPTPMLEFLRSDRTTSERKLRLFAAACCRRVWGYLDENNRHALGTLEQFVDGNISADSLGKPTVQDPSDDDWPYYGRDYTSDAVGVALRFDLSGHDSAFWVAELLRTRADNAAIYTQNATIARGGEFDAAHWKSCAEASSRAIAAERAAQSHWVREIFHGPRRPVHFRGHWRTTTLLQRAGDIYVNRKFEDMPILADDLEKAGCDSADILSHCRQPGPHVRGCWVIDSLLCKT